jgi:Lysylphosphatidylglycerol synthase TM region
VAPSPPRSSAAGTFPRWSQGGPLTVATLLYVAVLAVLALVAVALAGATGTANPVPGLQQTALILVVTLLAILALALRMSRRAAADRPARQPTPRRRCRGRWAPTGSGAAPILAHARNRWAQLRLLRLSSRSTAAAATGMLVSWLADISVLAVAFLALGAQPPWLGLLLAYCAGQIASSLPITPGGLGVVEASLTVALVAFGGCTAATLAAVLLYRLISHWLIIPTGAVAWLLLRTTAPNGYGDHRRGRGHLPPPRPDDQLEAQQPRAQRWRVVAGRPHRHPARAAVDREEREADAHGQLPAGLSARAHVRRRHANTGGLFAGRRRCRSQGASSMASSRDLER